jgi:hypothetical protein
MEEYVYIIMSVLVLSCIGIVIDYQLTKRKTKKLVNRFIKRIDDTFDYALWQSRKNLDFTKDTARIADDVCYIITRENKQKLKKFLLKVPYFADKEWSYFSQESNPFWEKIFPIMKCSQREFEKTLDMEKAISVFFENLKAIVPEFVEQAQKRKEEEE